MTRWQMAIAQWNRKLEEAARIHRQTVKEADAELDRVYQLESANTWTVAQVIGRMDA